MKFLVIGSTGRTGRHILDQGLRRGHEITAFARQPQSIMELDGLKNIIQGDAFNLETVRKAVQGQDAIISAVGSSGIACNLIATMPDAGVHRLVMTSSRSVVASRPWLAVTLAWLIFREPYADLARAEGMIEVSGLDWTIARATMLTNKPFTGQVHIDFEPNATGGDWTLGRADYAMALLDAAENPQMIGKALGIGGAKPIKQGVVRTA
ncbi:MAG: NAD(P)H-binding protein [Chloroflexota bacterium]